MSCCFFIFNLKRSALKDQQNKKLLHEYFLPWPLLTTQKICHIVTFDLQAAAQVCKRCGNRRTSSGIWRKVCIDLQDYWDRVNIPGMYTTFHFRQTGVEQHKSLITLSTALQRNTILPILNCSCLFSHSVLDLHIALHISCIKTSIVISDPIGDIPPGLLTVQTLIYPTLLWKLTES